MKRNQVKDIFTKDLVRKRNIVLFVLAIVFVFIISVCSLIMYLNNKRVEYVKYTENSNVEYSVYLKSNEFYKDNMLGENNEYISELVKNIVANFKYDISLEKEDVEFMYSYYIMAEVMVKDKYNHNTIYNFDEELVPKKTDIFRNNNLLIAESVDIDYNKYNDLIRKFVQVYNLNDTESYLTVNLYVTVDGSCVGEKDSVNETITTLEIPLTTRTMAFNVKNNIVDDDNVMLCIKPEKIKYSYIIVSIAMLLLGIFLTCEMVLYIVHTRSAQTVYEKELKKILSNYRSYIQKINSKFSLRGYQALKVDNFTDMLEIRDTTNQPILMVENSDKDSTYFVIPTSTKILYVYCIAVSDIEKEMRNNNR